MEREPRSARLKAKLATSNQGEGDPDFKEDSPNEFMDVDDEPETTANKSSKASKSKGKKRKAGANQSSAIQPASKKVRGKRGILKDLVEMPLDVLFEIFGQLDPIDLLHLSRTTKAIRDILMSKASLSVWKSSFENLEPPLPQCPEDLSEPAYADLAFGKGCHYCGRNTSSVRIAWQCRIRTCNKCMESYFAEKRGYMIRGYPSELVDLLPTVKMVITRGRHERLVAFYWVDRDDEWKLQYGGLKDIEKQEDWKEKNIKAATAVQQHSDLCRKWSLEKEDLNRRSQETAVENRRGTVVEHLKKMGWGEELDKIPSDKEKPQDQPIVTKACQKSLTERVLKGLEPALAVFMERTRRVRLEEEREAFLQKRLVPLRDAYDTYIETLPAAFGNEKFADIFHLPIIQDIVNDDTTPELSESHFERLRAAFPLVSDLWKAYAREQLISVVAKTLESYSSDDCPQIFPNPDKFLGEPSAFFTCLSCDLCIHARDLTLHPCLRDLYRYNAENLSTDEKLLRRTLGVTRWNLRGAKFDAGLSNRIDTILEFLGYNPRVLSAEELDKADPIVECILCHSEVSGRHTMPWIGMATHLSQEGTAKHDTKHFRLIEEPHASNIRRRIDNHTAKGFAGKKVMCATCREIGYYPSLLKHTRDVHGTIRPKMGKDVIVDATTRLAFFDKYQYCPRLWPPLDQEDVDALISS